MPDLKIAPGWDYDELRLGVPAMFQAEAGFGAGKRGEYWTRKPLDPPNAA